MDKKFKTIGAFIIASAIIWGAVIVGSSYALKGTECYDKIQNILVGGVLSHIILIWGPLALLFKKTKESKSENSIKE
jgi:hypothetical protein